jgi:hypothetical protein
VSQPTPLDCPGSGREHIGDGSAGAEEVGGGGGRGAGEGGTWGLPGPGTGAPPRPGGL